MVMKVLSNFMYKKFIDTRIVTTTTYTKTHIHVHINKYSTHTHAYTKCARNVTYDLSSFVGIEQCLEKFVVVFDGL